MRSRICLPSWNLSIYLPFFPLPPVDNVVLSASWVRSHGPACYPVLLGSLQQIPTSASFLGISTIIPIYRWGNSASETKWLDQGHAGSLWWSRELNLGLWLLSSNWWTILPCKLGKIYFKGYFWIWIFCHLLLFIIYETLKCNDFMFFIDGIYIRPLCKF